MTQQASPNPTMQALAKVPAVTLGFWIIKILATTLGETAGDAVSMSWLGETTSAATGWGYLIGTGLFIVPLIALIFAQIRAERFIPVLYWATIIASTTAGTTLADFFTRTLFTRLGHVDQPTAYLLGSLSLLFVTAGVGVAGMKDDRHVHLREQIGERVDIAVGQMDIEDRDVGAV